MPTPHTIVEGDCIHSLAHAHGFLTETIWNHGDNAALKSKRKDPSVLLPGDIVSIPDLTPREETKASDARHRFKLKIPQMHLRVKFLKPKPPPPPPPPTAPSPGVGARIRKFFRGSGGSSHGHPDANPATFDETATEGYSPDMEPRKNEAFSLLVSGERVTGHTDGSGLIDVPIPATAVEAEITFNPGTDTQEIIILAIGGMDPPDEVTGVRKRLNNLGFTCAPTGADNTPDLRDALRAFQTKNGLTASGAIDAPTRDKLKQVHGC